MTYKKEDDLVIITFSVKEFQNFLFVQGLVIGEISKYDKNLATTILKFIDKMNKDNPEWIRYFEESDGSLEKE